MYAAPAPVAAPSARRGGIFGGGTLLAICCLALILFLIAATIVIALIPIYIPRKNAGEFGPEYSFTATYDGSLGNDGSLDAQSRENIAAAIEQANGLPSGSVDVTNAVVATTPTKRRRRNSLLTRTRRGRTSAGIQRIYGQCRNRRRRCGSCRFRFVQFQKSIVIFLNGRRYVIVVIIIINPTPGTIPPTLPPSSGTTTASVSGSVTTTVAATPSVG